ncbi:Replication-associated protein [Smittium mucronatum]|uniref:Replication-associated protein n=1 Tax=Smittium mucronatum TaxID=133383 RepID=A0A1R0GRA3_9FUNG|nr:Replication-associated protein [Smittium mucronatum]
MFSSQASSSARSGSASASASASFVSTRPPLTVDLTVSASASVCSSPCQSPRASASASANAAGCAPLSPGFTAQAAASACPSPGFSASASSQVSLSAFDAYRDIFASQGSNISFSVSASASVSATAEDPIVLSDSDSESLSAAPVSSVSVPSANDPAVSVSSVPASAPSNALPDSQDQEIYNFSDLEPASKNIPFASPSPSPPPVPAKKQKKSVPAVSARPKPAPSFSQFVNTFSASPSRPVTLNNRNYPSQSSSVYLPSPAPSHLSQSSTFSAASVSRTFLSPTPYPGDNRNSPVFFSAVSFSPPITSSNVSHGRDFGPSRPGPKIIQYVPRPQRSSLQSPAQSSLTSPLPALPFSSGFVRPVRPTLSSSVPVRPFLSSSSVPVRPVRPVLSSSSSVPVRPVRPVLSSSSSVPVRPVRPVLSSSSSVPVRPAHTDEQQFLPPQHLGLPLDQDADHIYIQPGDAVNRPARERLCLPAPPAEAPVSYYIAGSRIQDRTVLNRYRNRTIRPPQASPVVPTRPPTRSSDGTFRLSAKSFFLTYPNCSLTKQEVYDELMKKPFEMTKYIIAVESHEAGHPHVHVYLKSKNKLNVKSARYFDIGGYHGEYGTCESASAVSGYVIKGGDFITNIDESEYRRIVTNAVQRFVDAPDFEEAMEIVMNDYNMGRDWVKNPLAYEQGVRYIKRKSKKIYRNPNYKFRELPLVSFWNPDKRVLWMHGGTGLGKTEFAKTLFYNPLLVKHIEQLKDLHSDHDGIIFDDTKFAANGWDRNDQLLLTDVENDNAFGVKYGAVHIPRLTGRIFISNNPIFYLDSAIRRRIFYIYIDSDLRLMEPQEYEDLSAQPGWAPDNVFLPPQ